MAMLLGVSRPENIVGGTTKQKGRGKGEKRRGERRERLSSFTSGVLWEVKLSWLMFVPPGHLVEVCFFQKLLMEGGPLIHSETKNATTECSA